MAAIVAALPAMRYKGRDASKDASVRNRLNRQASIHLKQLLGDNFLLPNEMDSVAFLFAALDKEFKLGNEDKAQDYDYNSLGGLINVLRDPSPAGIIQKLSTHAKRAIGKIATKMIVKVSQFKIAKLEETRYDGGVNYIKEEQTIIQESKPLDRWLIISEKRLFIVIMKKTASYVQKAGAAGNERCEREAVDSGMEIIDSIPFHEIASIEIWKKDGKNVIKDGWPGWVSLSKSDQEDKSDQNLRNGNQFLRISTQDDGFNCGNSFCISALVQIHSGEFSKDTISALRDYHTAAQKVFYNKTYLRKTQVWNPYRAGPAEMLPSIFREIKSFG
jgi:hypothetical protein